MIMVIVVTYILESNERDCNQIQYKNTQKVISQAI